MAIKTLSENVAQVKADFKSIKDELVNKGAEISSDTPTSEYVEYIKNLDSKLAFWNGFTVGGTRTYYYYGFSNADYDEFGDVPEGIALKPKTNINSMFNGYKGKRIPSGIDFSGITGTEANTQGVFEQMPYVTEIQDVGLPELGNYTRFYYNSYKVRKIAIMRVREKSHYENCFYNLKALEEICFDGCIAKALDIHWSIKLNRASVLSLLQHLTATVTEIAITLPKNIIDGATDTLTLIQNDAELNTAYTQALANGYLIEFS